MNPLSACVLALFCGPLAGDQPEARRILRFEDGETVRGRTRQVGETWQVKHGSEWIPCLDKIAAARLERDLLREADSLAAALEGRPVDDARQTEFLRWLAAEGLEAEMTRRLDELLEEDPDAVRILAFAEGRGLLAAPLPRSVEEQRALLEGALRAGPLTQERAARALAQLESHPGFDIFLASLRLQDAARERAFAYLLERRLANLPPWQPSARASLFDPSEEVRAAATRSLLARTDSRLLGPLLKGLEHESSLVQRNAAEALLLFAHPAAVQPLVASLARGGSATGGPRANFSSLVERAIVYDFDVEVAQGSAIADPQVIPVVEGVVLDVRIISSLEVIVDHRAAIRRALQGLTDGQARSDQGWLAWWKENGAQWSSEALLARPKTN